MNMYFSVFGGHRSEKGLSIFEGLLRLVLEMSSTCIRVKHDARCRFLTFLRINRKLILTKTYYLFTRVEQNKLVIVRVLKSIMIRLVSFL